MEPTNKGKKAQAFIASIVAADNWPDQCIEWPFYRDKDEYGRAWHDGTTKPAHCVVFEKVHGAYDHSLEVCHTCDNPPCVNPKHLFLGDRDANQADMVAKGRQARGMRAGSAKFSYEQIELVRVLRSQGMTQMAIAAETGISQSMVSKIVRGESRQTQ